MFFYKDSLSIDRTLLIDQVTLILHHSFSYSYLRLSDSMEQHSHPKERTHTVITSDYRKDTLCIKLIALTNRLLNSHFQI